MSAAWRANTSDKPGSTPMPTSARAPRSSHFGASSNCSSPSLTPVLAVRGLRIRMRERHSHVDVGDACSKGRPKDRHHEARIDRVQYAVAALGLQHVANGGLVGGVDPGSAEVVGGGPRRPFGAAPGRSRRSPPSRSCPGGLRCVRTRPTPPAPTTSTRTGDPLVAFDARRAGAAQFGIEVCLNSFSSTWLFSRSRMRSTVAVA